MIYKRSFCAYELTGIHSLTYIDEKSIKNVLVFLFCFIKKRNLHEAVVVQVTCNTIPTSGDSSCSVFVCFVRACVRACVRALGT